MIKKIAYLSLVTLIISCADQKKSNQSEDITQTEIVDTINSQQNISEFNAFDINTIPLTDKNLGEFPYLNPPKNYCYGSCSGYILGEVNPNDIKSFDIEYFAVNGKLIPVEGKSFKSDINKNRNEESSKYNHLIVDKSYEKAILDLGGVLVNSVPIPKSELDRIGDKELYEKQYGYSLDANLLDEIKTYIIRTKDKEVWIQYHGLEEESGRITILEKSDLKTEDVTLITASKIKQDIDKDGKAVLNINFDTDKATLKSDGKEVVDQILILLNENPSLKLSIEGHTDNTGTKEHNKKLSSDRATTIENYLTINGINKNRLNSKGIGQDQPLVPNNSEANKAKNRRVELIKIY